MCSDCYYHQTGGSLDNIGPLVRNRRVFQRGGGASLSQPQYYYYQSPYQIRGRGIGSVFMKFFKAVSPMLKKGLKSVGREALSASADILSDQSRRPIKEVIQSRSKRAYHNLKRKAEKTMEKVMEGSGISRGIKRRLNANSDQSILAIRPAKKQRKLKSRQTKKKRVVKNKNKNKIKDIFDY